MSLWLTEVKEATGSWSEMALASNASDSEIIDVVNAM